MNVRDVVRKAWQVTQVHLKKLIWYGAVPAFFSTIISSAYLAYQYNAFKHSQLFVGQEGLSMIKDVKLAWSMVSAHPTLAIILVVAGILIFLAKILLSPMFKGALIHALMQIKDYKPIHGSFEVGVRRFFPMFEFGIITGSFGIMTVLTESSFILRWWGENVFFIILPILLFIAVVGIIASFLFTYTEYFIILEKKRLVKSMMESTILVIANLRKTILVFILILLISARIILNVILILFIPLGVVLITGYFATQLLHLVGIIIASVFGLTILLTASYLMGLFEVFSTAVWVFTYSLLKERAAPPIKDVDLGGGHLKEGELTDEK